MNFTVDTEPPVIENVTVVYPEGQSSVKDNDTIIIKAKVADNTAGLNPDSIWVDGINLNGTSYLKMYDNGTNGDEVAGDDIYTRAVNLQTGEYTGYKTFIINARDIVPNADLVRDSVYVDNTKPTVSLNITPLPKGGPDSLNGEVPGEYIILKENVLDTTNRVKKITIIVKDTSGNYIGKSPVIITNISDTFSTPLTLQKGINKIHIEVNDDANNIWEKNIVIVGDTTKPNIDVVKVFPNPSKGDSLNGEVYTDNIVIQGKYHDYPDTMGVQNVVITMKDKNGNSILTSPISIKNEDNAFSQRLHLIEGENHILIKAIDKLDNTDTESVIITYKLSEVSQVIGRGGGKIISPDGTMLDIPPGALSSPTKITIKKLTPEEIIPPSNDSVKLLRIAHKFEPEGLIFHKPVTMVLAYTDFEIDTTNFSEDSLSPFFYDKNRWVKASAGEVNTDSNTITLLVNHLSTYDLGIDRRILPTTFSLYLTRNPFNLKDGTTIVFAAPSPGRLTLKIYDLAGDVVAIPVRNYDINAKGEYSIKWNGLSETGRFHGSGIYVYVAFFTDKNGGLIDVKRDAVGVIK